VLAADRLDNGRLVPRDVMDAGTADRRNLRRQPVPSQPVPNRVRHDAKSVSHLADPKTFVQEPLQIFLGDPTLGCVLLSV
jgi:hypothetical protein